MTTNKESTFIAIRVTPEEREHIREVSAQSQTTISDVVRAGFGLPTRDRYNEAAARAAKIIEREIARSTQFIEFIEFIESTESTQA